MSKWATNAVQNIYALSLFFISIEANGSRLGEVVDFEKLSLKFLLTLNRITNEQFRTKPTILPNRC